MSGRVEHTRTFHLSQKPLNARLNMSKLEFILSIIYTSKIAVLCRNASYKLSSYAVDVQTIDFNVNALLCD